MPRKPLGYGKLEMRYNNSYCDLLRKWNHFCFLCDRLGASSYSYFEEDFEYTFKMYTDYLDEKGYKYLPKTEKRRLKKYLYEYRERDYAFTEWEANGGCEISTEE